MSRPNFRIIEGEYEDIDYESFKKDYMNQFVHKSEILKKYGLKHNRYLKYGRRVYEETGFKRKSGVPYPKDMTNIRRAGHGKYSIYKVVNGKKLFYGTYDTVEEARKVRNFLIEHNWSSNAIDYCINGRLS